MDILSKITKYFSNTLEFASLGLSLIEIIAILCSIILAIIIRGLIANIIISKIKKIIKKTGNTIDDKFFNSLAPPLKLIPFLLIFILLGMFVEVESNWGAIIDKTNQTLVTIFIFWFLHQFLTPISQVFIKFERIFSRALLLWMTRSAKYLIIFLGSVAVLETWGIKIGPVIAGLGLFGVAVALGAQDLFKNLISGIMIILEKRFHIDDVIEVPGHATGTVEHIGFRSTLIRQFDSTPISIPNYVFSDSSIINYAERRYRRINWVIGLTYDSSIKQLKDICDEINSYILNSNDFISNDLYKTLVRVEKFSDSSIDILISTFTNTNDWDKYLKIKEDLVYSIKNVIELNKGSFAFPSRSIYIEKE